GRTSACRPFPSPSSWSCSSIPDRSRRGGPSPTCSCEASLPPASSPPRAAITGRPSPTPRCDSASPRRSSCRPCRRPRRRIREYSADLVVGGERYADALAASEAWVRQSGALPVHAFDQVETLLGQGTIGLELATQAPALDTLLVAVGGGGLIGGIAA